MNNALPSAPRFTHHLLRAAFCVMLLTTLALAQNSGQEQRPVAEPMQIQQASPQLMKVLEDWYQKTKEINKLDGEHRRWVYDYVFGVEKRSKGKFYYESPDKGRIDITGLTKDEIQNEVGKGLVARVNPRTGQSFSLKGDLDEQWVCDGAQILKINNEEKQFEAHQIPAENRGQNIMDGPLPFLFGMPPQKALQRYQIQLVNENGDRVYLVVYPRRRSDAANWKEAKVILRKSDYLPEAVMLLDPAGNKETTFKFADLTVNRSSLFNFFGSKPFEPNLRGYRRAQVGDAVAVQPPAAVVPSVIGLHGSEAKKVIEGSGYKAEFVKGGPAPQEKFIHRVSHQEPSAKAPLQPGGVVRLTYFEKQP
ncbi:hypothetical protein [Calycomorphotria hydatis]|nr:hypothetical protein [Calycomorphotria hydatis]